MARGKNIAVIGAQWGDEGKGKIIDYLAKDVDYVVRFHGGNNAGHTVVNNLGTFKMHLIPSGVFYPKVKAVIGNGVIIDPETLFTEINELKKAKIRLEKRLIISPRAHLIMPYHKLLDGLYEDHKGAKKTGTLRKGISPCYADKVSYQGIRVSDILRPEIFKEKLKIYLTIKNKVVIALGGNAFSFEELYEQYLNYGKQLKSFVQDALMILVDANRRGKKILYEGAHGMLLDNDWGTYPYVTASSVVPGSIQAGASGNPWELDRVIGIVKAYTTRVGGGPMPTELSDEIGAKLQSIGKEIGTTSGRTRRCGWFDAELVRYSCLVGKYTELVLTKLDVLDTFKTIKVCIGYQLGSKKVSWNEIHTEDLYNVKPIYQELPGWNTALHGIRSYQKLPTACKKYIDYLEKICGTPISLVSHGPERSALLKR